MFFGDRPATLLNPLEVYITTYSHIDSALKLAVPFLPFSTFCFVKRLGRGLPKLYTYPYESFFERQIR